jgi:pimeloyl-ACP methyl ester carboxylesterase
MYEGAMGMHQLSEIPLLSEASPIPTLALDGSADHCIWSDFPERCEAAFTELVGPFVVPRAGHFVQWERADLLNQAIRYFAGNGIG